MWSLMPAADAADHATMAAEERVPDSERGEPDSGRTFARPASDWNSAHETAASLVNATGARGATGVCCPQVLPNRLVRSQLESGAVNGRIKTTSQEARNFDSIGQLMFLSRR